MCPLTEGWETFILSIHTVYVQNYCKSCLLSWGPLHQQQWFLPLEVLHLSFTVKSFMYVCYMYFFLQHVSNCECLNGHNIPLSVQWLFSRSTWHFHCPLMCLRKPVWKWVLTCFHPWWKWLYQLELAEQFWIGVFRWFTADVGYCKPSEVPFRELLECMMFLKKPHWQTNKQL